jgi:hypothetical protein
MSTHPEVLWAQRSSETDASKVRTDAFFLPLREHLTISIVGSVQCVVFLTVNLPDIIESSLQYNLTATSLSFKAKAGK